LICILSQATLFGGNKRYEILLNMVHHNPGEPLFSTRYTSPEYLSTLGYTGQVPKIEMQCGLTYDDFDENVVPLHSDARHWIDRKAADCRIQIKRAKDAGLEICPFTDILVVPKYLMDKYGAQMRDSSGRISILMPRTQEIIRAQIREIFWRYPDLDGITFRHGETYLYDTPYHVGGSPARTPEEHAMLVNLLREEICVKLNKKVYYRTWDFGILHTNPDLYLETFNNVEPHPNLYVLIKHVNNDYVRGFPFNTTIGIGNHQQIVEISVNQAGDYGRNSHPYYIGKGVIDGWNDIEEKKGIRDLYDVSIIKGFWIWTWGDGWVGPYYDNELWLNLNEYVIRTYVRNPKRSEESIFYEYARKHLNLSKADADKFRTLCLMSEDAVLWGQETRKCAMNIWWIRDESLSEIDLSDAVKKGVQREIIVEKEENLKRWYEMEKLSKEIHLPNAADQEFLQVSTTYGRIKYEVVLQIWKMEVMRAEKQVLGKNPDKAALKAAMDAYDSKMDEWWTLKKAHPCCPTLYRPWRKHEFTIPFEPRLEELKELYNKFDSLWR